MISMVQDCLKFLWLVNAMGVLTPQLAWLKRGCVLFVVYLLTYFCHCQRYTFLDRRGRFQTVGKSFLLREWSHIRPPNPSFPWWPWWKFWAQPLVSLPQHYFGIVGKGASFDVEDTQRKAKDKGRSTVSVAPLTLDNAWLVLLAQPHTHGFSISSEGAGRAFLLVESRGWAEQAVQRVIRKHQRRQPHDGNKTAVRK